MMRNVFIFIVISVIGFCAKAQSPGAKIDVQHYDFALQLNDANDIIKGEATIVVKFLKSVNSFNIDLVKKKTDGKGMVVSQIKENGRPVKFTQSADAITLSAAAKKAPSIVIP